MVYDLVPPLVFFGSLGGLIVVISRVLMRMRRTRAGEEIAQKIAPVPDSYEAEALRPTTKKIYLAKNQLHLAWQQSTQFAKDSTHALKNKVTKLTPKKSSEATAPPASITAEPGVGLTASSIVIPHTSLRERLLTRSASGGRMIAASVLFPVRRLGRAWQAWRAIRRQSKASAAMTRVTPDTTPVTPPASDTPLTPKIRLTRVTEASAPTTANKPQPSPRRVSARLVSPMFFRKTEAPSALRAAQEALGAGNYQQVEYILVPYLMKHLKDIEAYMLLGEAANKQEHWPEAMEIFEQVVSINPQAPGAYAGLGYAAYRAGKVGKALPALQRAVDANPEDRLVLDCLLKIARNMDNRALQHSIQEKLAAIS